MKKSGLFSPLFFAPLFLDFDLFLKAIGKQMDEGGVVLAEKISRATPGITPR